MEGEPLNFGAVGFPLHCDKCGGFTMCRLMVRGSGTGNFHAFRCSEQHEIVLPGEAVRLMVEKAVEFAQVVYANHAVPVNGKLALRRRYTDRRRN